MKLLPLIYIKNKKIRMDKKGKPISKKIILNEFKNESEVYILDIDGIKKGKPNLCIYQKLSNICDLWVDFGPRTLGDIVDVFFSGINRITIRKKLCPKLNAADVREITENKFYSNIELENNRFYDLNDSFFKDSDGLVNFYSINQIKNIKSNINYLIQSNTKNKIITYEENPSNIKYWSSIGIKDFITEKNKIEEFSKWIRK